jgi:Methylamine utilisation protein MauE
VTSGLLPTLLADVREVQPPFIAVLLIGGSAAKLARVIRSLGEQRRAGDQAGYSRRYPGGRPAGFPSGPAPEAALGPTQLFPVRLRRPLAVLLSAAELSLALALLVTVLPVSTHPGTPLFAPLAATGARIAAAAFFLIAGAALVELRERRPGLGCGCFGDLSTQPPGLRSIARAAMLTLGAVISLNTPALYLPPRGHGILLFLGVVAAELALLIALSPEVGEALVRLGYTAPCELRTWPAGHTVAALHRSRAWRDHAAILVSELPADTWRELCWRYLVFPGRLDGRDTEVVFAVQLKRRRPAVLSAVVPAAPRASRPPAPPPAIPAPRREHWVLR